MSSRFFAELQRLLILMQPLADEIFLKELNSREYTMVKTEGINDAH